MNRFPIWTAKKEQDGDKSRYLRTVRPRDESEGLQEGKFLSTGKAHLKRKCKTGSETVAVESEGLGGRTEGGKASDSRYGDWLNSSNPKSKEKLSKYFLQVETICFKLKILNLQLRTFLLYNRILEKKMVQWTGFKLSDQGYSLSFVGASSASSKPPEAKREMDSNRFVIVRAYT